MSAASAGRVLVVDDNAITRKVVRLTLEGAGYTVLEATDGQEALRLAALRPPDLILLDLRLPDVDGAELVERLRVLRAGATVPIIAFSGYLSRFERSQSLYGGFTDYLFKPVEPSLLLQVVEGYLPHHAAQVSRPGIGWRVLVADDDLVQLKLLRLRLQDAGYQVVTASDGQAALRQAQADPPDAIVSDVLMPGLDGFRLCDAIKGDPRLARIPVVLVSSRYTEQADRDLATRVGASAFALKTADLSDVLESLRAAIENRASAPAGRSAGMPLEEYTTRVIQQLERQANLNVALVQRMARRTAELSTLATLADTVRSELPTDQLLAYLLQQCLDAAGLSMGAVHLLGYDGSWAAAARLGYPKTAERPLRALLQLPTVEELLNEEHGLVVVPSARVPTAAGQKALAALRASTMLIARIASIEEPLGALVLASTSQVLAEDRGAFALAVAAQMGQAVDLARNVERLRESNRRLEDTLAELRDTQQRIVQNERLQAMGQMASGIAHDFNNALAPILGFSDLLLDSPENLDDRPKVIRYLEMIRTAAEGAAGVVRRLREFYRPNDEGEVFEPLDLNSLVEQTLLLTQPRWKDQMLAAGKALQVATQLEPIPPVLGSGTQLQEALINVILNAVDALREGGDLTVSTRSEEQGVVLEVRDTGPGMSDDVRRRCLEPFFSTKGRQGTGLGLPMTHGIVQRHKGRLEIDSEVGVGTTVRIWLPLALEPASSRATPAGAGAQAPLRILVVDDEPAVRDFLAAGLAGDGHSVETAENGREGLEKFRSGEFDLVVTDRAMPEMNGTQLAAAVKAASPQTPVILVTGFGDLLEPLGYKPAGVDLILSKPVGLQALRQAIQKATAQYA